MRPGGRPVDRPSRHRSSLLDLCRARPVVRAISWNQVAFVLPALLSVALFAVTSYLAQRFDEGSPLTHSVDPYLTIWLSISAGVIVVAAWAIAAAVKVGPSATRRHSRRRKARERMSRQPLGGRA
jgi:hypothetical protein